MRAYARFNGDTNMTTSFNKRKPAVNLYYSNVEGFIHNLNATTPNTQLDINAGMCRDSSDTFDINVGDYRGTSATANAVTTLDATAVAQLNGLDTGSLAADKMYYLYAISSSSAAVPSGFILSLDAEQPVMPYDYDLLRLVGVQPTNSSAQFIPMTVVGYGNSRRVSFNSPPIVLNSQSDTSATEVALTNLAPSITDGIKVALKVDNTPNAAGDSVILRILDAGTNYFVSYGQVSLFAVTDYVEIPALLNSSDVPAFEYFVSDASSAATIELLGFDLEL